MEDTDEPWEIRLVLLGNVGAGKSASGNTLLGATGFVSRISPCPVTKNCVAQTVTLRDRQIIVVDTPGLTAKMVTDTAKENLLHCLQLSAPGPHVFLLVVPVGRFTQEERDTVERVVAVFGTRLYMFSIILFTFKDRLKNTSIERFIISAGDDLQQLVQKCGSRYHAFNNENPGNEDQVGPLLAQIDKLVAANGGSWYTQVTDMEESEGRNIQQLLGDKKDYEATFKSHVTKPGVNKGARVKEKLSRLDDQLWKQDKLRASDNRLSTSEEQMEMEAERKEIERQRDHIEALKEEMRQLSLTKQVAEKEVEELENKRIQAQTLERESQSEIIKLQEERTKLQEELKGVEEQIKRNSEQIEKQMKEVETNQEKIWSQERAHKEGIRDIRRKEGDLQTLQDIYDQLDNRLYSSNYMQDCDTEEVLTVELEIIEKMKKELQRSSEEMKTKEQTMRRREQESSMKNDDAAWGSAGTSGQTIQKACEEDLPQKSLIKNTDHPDTQGIKRKATLKYLVEILQRLNLKNYYPNKLTIESVLSIGSPKENQSDSNVAFIYLKKLLMLNYKARFITEENENKDFTLSTTRERKCHRIDGIEFAGVFDAMNDDGSNYGGRCKTLSKGTLRPVAQEDILCESDHLNEFLNERTVSSNTNEKETIHPMDVQMAVFHCADSFLKQNMVTKLSSCQYALPLLVPSPTSTDIELPLWTFRQIKKTWKSVGGLSTSLPVCQVKAPMVFFCRLGSVSTSKSQLLNSMINPKHDTFFHRDSPGSSRNRLFMEGLVEIAWYCPAGNTDDLFSECIAFCNLHGDAAEHKVQTDFLTERATVNIVLMENVTSNDKEKELLEKLHKSPKPFICVVCDLQKSQLKISHGFNVKIGLKGTNRNESDNDLTSAIQACLQRCDFSPTFNLEESSDCAKWSGFRVDEDDEDCKEGRAGALEVMKLLESENISEIKNKFLPCQGKLWHDWTKSVRWLHHLRGGMEHNRNVTLTEMKKIRMQQRDNNLRIIRRFVKNLMLNSTTQTRYFLQWIRCFIDAKFSDQVSQVNLKYNSKWLEVQKLKNTQGKSEELAMKQRELEEVSEELDTVTFGLEHIFREMGQIYEAWATVPAEMGTVPVLPALAADLLISGHPLELMDGDAAHVPLTWIESVLDKVTETLGDQRVFVLSVLGLQSSGKSTMLNAMFGLQFAVSAGRCTRGAFMQLVRVKEEVKEELKFEYLLVLDTGGLRSLERVGKSAYRHDTELVTFVSGLANMTLINIFGENPAEMEGILHVAIQTVLRMKKVKLNPSCMFVHQNITDITTSEKNMERRLHLQEKMDELTCLVAKEEGCDVKCFSELIQFNIQTDVHYLAPLWEGNPPMAPPNPRYSENIEGLKQAVLTAAAQQKVPTFSELKVRIRDLWTAVLNKDFVFSFRKSLETSATEN